MSEADRAVQLLRRLLRYRRAPAGVTAEFRNLRHNDDLCPWVESKLEEIMQSYNIQTGLSYDIQGPRDRGADVVLKVDDGDGHSYICFQIKSHEELGQRELPKLLRDQLSQAEDSFQPMLDYYILPFADEIARRDQLRSANEAMLRKPLATVISPSLLYTFMHLPGTKVDAYIKSIVGEDDPVWRRAWAEIFDLSTTQAIILLVALEGRLSGQNLSIETLPGGHPLLVEAYSTIPDWPDEFLEISNLPQSTEDIHPLITELISEERWKEGQPIPDQGRDQHERFHHDLAALEDDLELVGDRDLSLDLMAYPALLALMTDGCARFGYEGSTLVEYVMTLFRIEEPWGLLT